jgi:hypothetical protein
LRKPFQLDGDTRLSEDQQIFMRGGEDVVMSVRECRRLTGQMPRLVDSLLYAPRGEMSKFDRPVEAIRDLPLFY